MLKRLLGPFSDKRCSNPSAPPTRSVVFEPEGTGTSDLPVLGAKTTAPSESKPAMSSDSSSETIFKDAEEGCKPSHFEPTKGGLLLRTPIATAHLCNPGEGFTFPRPLSSKGSASALSIRDLVADLRVLSARAPPPGLVQPTSRSTRLAGSGVRMPSTRAQSIREMVAEMKELSERAPVQPKQAISNKLIAPPHFHRPPPASASVPCLRALAAAADDGLKAPCDVSRAQQRRPSPLLGNAVPQAVSMFGIDPWQRNPLRAPFHRLGSSRGLRGRPCGPSSYREPRGSNVITSHGTPIFQRRSSSACDRLVDQISEMESSQKVASSSSSFYLSAEDGQEL
jgi:hypothetical protein